MEESHEKRQRDKEDEKTDSKERERWIDRQKF